MADKQKNLNIDLHIKSLCIKVTDKTPVYVIWQRGKVHKINIMNQYLNKQMNNH